MHMAESALSSTQSITEDKWSQNASVLNSMAIPSTHVTKNQRNSQSQELESSFNRYSDQMQPLMSNQRQDGNQKEIINDTEMNQTQSELQLSNSSF